MTAEDLDALAADVGSKRGHDGCDLECSGRKLVELARGYLSLRLVQTDHERQIAALQAAFDDMQKAYLRVCGEPARDLPASAAKVLRDNLWQLYGE